MQYHYDSIHHYIAKQVSKMVEDNYANEENKDDIIVIFRNLWLNPTRVKQELDAYGRTYRKVIIYQLEPLVDNHWHNKERIIENLRGADEVWDYDLDNIEVLRANGIDAKFRPFRYSKSLKTIESAENPEISLYFYGTHTEKRNKELREYLNHFISRNDEEFHIFANLGFVWTYRTSEDFQNRMMANSKIILNMNPYDGECRQQQPRIIFPLVNGKCVLSQKSNRNYYGNSIVEFTDKEDLGDKVIWLLRNDNWKNFTNWNGEMTV